MKTTKKLVKKIKNLRIFKDKKSFYTSLQKICLPVVSFEDKNGNKINFLVDTGATYSVLSEELLDRLEYTKTEKEFSSKGITGESVIHNEVYTFSLYNKNKKYKGLGYVDSYGKLFADMSADYGEKIHGLLGSHFFFSNFIIIDFSNCNIYV